MHPDEREQANRLFKFDEDINIAILSLFIPCERTEHANFADGVLMEVVFYGLYDQVSIHHKLLAEPSPSVKIMKSL